MPPVDYAARARDAARKSELSPAHSQRLRSGEHEAVARELSAERPALAAWVLEQVWDFVGATRLYLAAGQPVEALRSALEAGDPQLVDTQVRTLAEAGGQDARAGAKLLTARRRHEAAAMLLAAADSGPQAQASALLASGDKCGAARVWLDAGEPRAALDALGELDDEASTVHTWQLAARAWWELGDADASARAAQAGLRKHAGLQTTTEVDAAAPGNAHVPELRARLTEALRALGHPVAAQVVLDLADEQQHSALSAAQARVAAAGGHGRYRVLAAHPAAFAGSAYVGLDRVTHEEVEVHLLLADQFESGTPEPAMIDAVRSFIDRARAATATPHAALRPLLRAEVADGLVVLPRASGLKLRELIRPPGLAERPERARAFTRFLAEGLAHVHRHGFAHGGVLPSLITADALGRPQLGPAGTDLLSGLAATRTGGLDELLTLTAPEVRRGRELTPAADLYALGRIWMGLITGHLDTDLDSVRELEVLEPRSLSLLESLIQEEPSARPTADAVAEALRRPVRDLRDVRGGGAARQAPGDSGLRMVAEVVGGETVLEVSAQWTSEDIDALCALASPWLQTITRRQERVLWLRPWPDASARFGGDADPTTLLDPRALAPLDAELVARIGHALRARPCALIQTPAGEWMLGLDELLAA